MEVLSGPVSCLQQWPKSDKDGELEEQVKHLRYFLAASLSVSIFFELKASPKLDILFLHGRSFLIDLLP